MSEFQSKPESEKIPNQTDSSRCDSCDYYVWEHTDVFGKPEGHCQFSSSVDGRGPVCEHFKSTS